MASHRRGGRCRDWNSRRSRRRRRGSRWRDYGAGRRDAQQLADLQDIGRAAVVVGSQRLLGNAIALRDAEPVVARPHCISLGSGARGCRPRAGGGHPQHLVDLQDVGGLAAVEGRQRFLGNAIAPRDGKPIVACLDGVRQSTAAGGGCSGHSLRGWGGRRAGRRRRRRGGGAGGRRRGRRAGWRRLRRRGRGRGRRSGGRLGRRGLGCGCGLGCGRRRLSGRRLSCRGIWAWADLFSQRSHCCRFHTWAAYCAGHCGRSQNHLGLEGRTCGAVGFGQHSQHNHRRRSRGGAVRLGCGQAGGGVQHLAAQVADPRLDARQALLGAFLHGAPTARGHAGRKRQADDQDQTGRGQHAAASCRSVARRGRWRAIGICAGEKLWRPARRPAATCNRT